MRRPRIVGDVIENWQRIAAGRRTLVFACDKAHAQDLVEQFLRAGVIAELLTDDHSDEQREAVIARLEAGATMVVVNCFLLSYGIDAPCVECICLARPTRSVVLYMQCIGRGLRPHPGKTDALILDHGRVVESLGLPTDDFGWTLAAGDNANARAALAMARKSAAERPRICAECGCVWSVPEAGPQCPHCGWQPAPQAKPVRVQAGTLSEIDALIDPPTPEMLEQFCCEALGFYRDRWPDRWEEKPNKGRWWAWSQTRARFALDSEPVGRRLWGLQPLDPSPPVYGWLRSQLIRYAKARAQEQRHARF